MDEERKVSVQEEGIGETFLIPHARLVEIARSKKTSRKFVRRKVYVELNRRIKRMVEEIFKEMFNSPNSYVEFSDLDRAMRKFSEADEIIKEKSRVVKHLESMKADIDKLVRDLRSEEI